MDLLDAGRGPNIALFKNSGNALSAEIHKLLFKPKPIRVPTFE